MSFIAMLRQKDLLPLTGYIHGGCSPLGMRKQLRTVVDVSARDCRRFYVSGGKVGLQIEMDFGDLGKVLDFRLEDITR